jgi:hypothetical protein
MADQVEIKPGDKIKIKRIGLLGKVKIEKTEIEGIITRIGSFTDNPEEAGKIIGEITFAGGKKFFLDSSCYIEVV